MLIQNVRTMLLMPVNVGREFHQTPYLHLMANPRQLDVLDAKFAVTTVGRKRWSTLITYLFGSRPGQAIWMSEVGIPMGGCGGTSEGMLIRQGRKESHVSPLLVPWAVVLKLRM